ncbi:MAG: diguanylate cyclase [Bacillota bacterium]
MEYNKLYAAFTDKQLEKEFLEYERDSTLKHLRPLVLALGILFFLFVIPDYFLNPSARVFWAIFLLRTIYLFLIIFFFIMLGKKEIQANLQDWISVYALIVTIFYLLIYYQYEVSVATSPFFVQSLAVVVFILVFFSLDSHWLHMVVISLFLSAGFMIVSYYRQEGIPLPGFAAVFVYIILALVISSISAYRINLYKRMQFINRRELKELSEKDVLTGIFGRSKFDAELKRWLGLARRYQYSFALIMLDVDDLKAVNDQHGHLVGDRVLKEFTVLVQGRLRSSDVFARWGGDEFIILLPDADLDQAVQMADRIRDTIASYKFSHGDTVSCSFGVSGYEEGDDHIKVVQRADNRLYQAKNKGKSQVVSEG